MENATVFVVTGKLLLLVEIVSFWGLFSKKKTKKKKKKKKTHQQDDMAVNSRN